MSSSCSYKNKSTTYRINFESRPRMLNQFPQSPPPSNYLLLASSLTDPLPLVGKNQNLWKPGYSKCNNFATLPLSLKQITSSSLPPSSKTRLPFGGDTTTKESTGRTRPLTGRDS
jgi:hypothetical protein